MSWSNSYLRALVVNAVLFLAVVLRIMQDLGSQWSPRHTVMFTVLGMVSLITTLLVGTISRRSPVPWPWLKVILMSIGCAFAILGLVLLVQKTGFFR